jgi:hypothetical protein
MAIVRWFRALVWRWQQRIAKRAKDEQDPYNYPLF